MSTELVDANVVVAARQFNPSVLSQLWLVRRGLVGEEDFREGCIFADAIAQVNTDEFSLLVVPPRAQFTTSVPRDQQQRLIVEKMGGLVHALPETPYRAVGINLTWQLVPENEDIGAVCHRLAFVPQSPVHELFESPDARFGSYLSKDSLGCRLKLDMRPAIAEVAGREPQDIILLAFNYHRDIAAEEEPLPIIDQLLRKWDEAVEETTRIVQATGVQ